MNKIYLQRKDLEQLTKFLDAFKSDQVEIYSDTSSGIGAIITARITDLDINGMQVAVEKIISDESDW